MTALSLSRLNNTGIHKFHDLRAYSRVFHVVLESFGVPLCLLEDGLHNGVVHDILETIIQQGQRLEKSEDRSRTAISGSRIARCSVSSSLSPSLWLNRAC